MKPCTRRKLYLAIAECDFKAVDLASSLGVSRACVFKEIRVLLDEGIIRMNPSSKRLYMTKKGKEEIDRLSEVYLKLSSCISESFSLSQLEGKRAARDLLEGC